MSQYSKLTVKQLVQLCKEHSLPYSKKKKNELVTLLSNVKQENNLSPRVVEKELSKEELYFQHIRNVIKDVFEKSKNEDMLEDILLSDYIKKNQSSFNIVKNIKQLQMKIGYIWQCVIGDYPGFENLKQGHSTGLDVLCKERKFVMEIKNRFNTDNQSARNSNYNKLIKFKNDNPEYECIYAVINDRTSEGFDKLLPYKGSHIRYCSGNKLLDLVFGNEKERIISFVKSQINLHLNK